MNNGNPNAANHTHAHAHTRTHTHAHARLAGFVVIDGPSQAVVGPAETLPLTVEVDFEAAARHRNPSDFLGIECTDADGQVLGLICVPFVKKGGGGFMLCHRGRLG